MKKLRSLLILFITSVCGVCAIVYIMYNSLQVANVGENQNGDDRGLSFRDLSADSNSAIVSCECGVEGILRNLGNVSIKTNDILHTSIHINGNADFASQASANGWPGDGTERNPYIIEAYEIDANGGSYGIWIENTCVWFVIRNCKVWNATDYNTYPWGTGISLANVTNGTLENNTCSGNEKGICLNWASRNNTITNNNCYGNEGEGIYLLDATNNTITNNTCSKNRGGIFLLGSNNTITNNNCSNNSDGIVVFSGVPPFSSNNTITNNTCSGNSYKGIYLFSSPNNILTNNYCFGNGYGIVVVSSNNTITRNYCLNNSCGIDFNFATYNTITNNNCSGNSEYGMRLSFSSTNMILYNNFHSNIKYAIYITNNSTGNTIHYNNFWQNNRVGKTTTDSKSQACDEVGGNFWYDITTHRGNYWDDWDGRNWGIRTAYSIDGGAYDKYPLLEPVYPNSWKCETPAISWYEILLLASILVLSVSVALIAFQWKNKNRKQK